MSLLSDIRAQIVVAMKGGPDAQVKKTILRQVVSETQRLNTEADEDVYRIIRKLVDGNNEALQIGGPNAQLVEENKILDGFLPRMLASNEIRGSLSAVAEEIRAAKSDGQAIGVAMKWLKSLGSSVNGKDVGEVVREIREVES